MPPSWVFPAARGQTWMSVGFQLLAVWCLQLANFSVVHKYALVNYNPWHPGSPLSRNIFFFFFFDHSSPSFAALWVSESLRSVDYHHR